MFTKFYQANSELRVLLLNLGFNKTSSEPNIREDYFYHKEKYKQVKIDYDTKVITFIEKSGVKKEESQNYTEEQIVEFLNS